MLAVYYCRTLLLYRKRDVPCSVDRLHLRQDQVRTLIYYPPILIALLMILPGYNGVWDLEPLHVRD